MNKNAIKMEIFEVGGNNYFPRFWAINLANLAINWTKIGDF